MKIEDYMHIREVLDSAVKKLGLKDRTDFC